MKEVEKTRETNQKNSVKLQNMTDADIRERINLKVFMERRKTRKYIWRVERLESIP